MEILFEIAELLQKGRAKDIKEKVVAALQDGVSADDILNKGLIEGMNVIGTKFKNNEVYVPEVLIAARAMNAALEILKPVLAKSGSKPVGKVLICTVRGDLHDIGKNLVKIMIEGQGIEVVDIGVDASEAKIIDAVKTHKPSVVCLSSLLTTTMSAQKDTIDALQKAGLRNKLKIVVGGAPLTQAFAEKIGADGYAADAASAAVLVRSFF